MLASQAFSVNWLGLVGCIGFRIEDYSLYCKGQFAELEDGFPDKGVGFSLFGKNIANSLVYFVRILALPLTVWKMGASVRQSAVITS